ncbi:MAG: N-acetylmuramoyl-L-alanine amidase [Nocardioidaceae bacterium]|nr:MAG: N-acetylmuramoyl-L-alanine amidase [Nocardioidaceae bacterium]
MTAGLAAAVATAVGLGVLSGVGREPEATTAPRPTQATTHALATTSDSTSDKPLAGKVVVIDPGHQLGNSRFPSKINRLVDAGGFKKPCNTTGTSTNSGYAEATFNFKVAKVVQRRLKKLGATVVMTRKANRYDRWGPCVDFRGRLGNKLKKQQLGADKSRAGTRADLKLSIHGDGSAAGNRGFHIIVSTHKTGHRATSKAYAKRTRAALWDAGFKRSTYIGGGTALSFRGDLATLNLSRIPAVMVELGNMRNAKDAKQMTSAKGQRKYGRALVRAIRAQLEHG